MPIFVTDRAGREHAAEATANWTVMEIVRDADLPMRAECGGSLACATCHVYVDPAWEAEVGPPGEDERDVLDGAFEVRSNSRLSCQIVFTPNLDGLKVTLSKDAAD
jgi:2Fe-2S ferredoxin